MKYFGKPRNLPESFGLAILILSLAGLFPFHFNRVKNKFEISYSFFCLTITHIIVFTYVNVTCLMENWLDFVQPMVGHSELTAFGNLLFRLLSMVITYLILAPLLLGSPYYVTSLNIYIKLINEFITLGIDVRGIYTRIYQLTCFYSAIILVSLLLTAWHCIHFYKLITQQTPHLRLYFIAFLGDFYKILFLFHGSIQLIAVYLIARQLNGILKQLLLKRKDNFKEKYFFKTINKQGVFK